MRAATAENSLVLTWRTRRPEEGGTESAEPPVLRTAISNVSERLEYTVTVKEKHEYALVADSQAFYYNLDGGCEGLAPSPICAPASLGSRLQAGLLAYNAVDPAYLARYAPLCCSRYQLRRRAIGRAPLTLPRLQCIVQLGRHGSTRATVVSAIRQYRNRSGWRRPKRRFDLRRWNDSPREAVLQRVPIPDVVRLFKNPDRRRWLLARRCGNRPVLPAAREVDWIISMSPIT